MIDAAGDVGEVHAREAVDCAGVAAYREGFGNDGGHLHEVEGECRGGVFVDGTEGAAVPEFVISDRVCFWRFMRVPVVGDAFIAGSVC